MKRVIDYKQLEMTDEECAYLDCLIAEFPDAKDQLRDLFQTDGDGCITILKPPVKRQIAWGLLFFFQNLMINQRLRRLETAQAQELRHIEERAADATKRLYDLAKDIRNDKQNHDS